MQRFYFDHNATTPVAPAVIQAMADALAADYGNPSSIHYHGQQARKQLEAARCSVAALLGASPKEVVFTSGGTESDNLALFGAVRASTRASKHIVTSAIEHPAVLQACAQLEREGVAVTYVAPDANGVITADAVQGAFRDNTVLVSIMHVNNELGTVQPIAEIASLAKRSGVLLHSDGVQAAGKLPVKVDELGVDLYSISAHKLNGPKGCGALYVRKGVKIASMQYGGRHEQGRRAGTENVPSVVGFGAAAQLAAEKLIDEQQRLATLRDALEVVILARVPGIAINGRNAARVSNTTNLQFAGVGGESVVIALDLKGFAVSSGSACSSGAVEPSHVLLALGLSPDEARSSVRISMGSGNDQKQVDRLVDAIAAVAAHLQRLSPALAHA